MRITTAKTIATAVVWVMVAAVLTSLNIKAPADTITQVFVGVAIALSAGAAVSTVAIWRSSAPGDDALGKPRPVREV